ncbi:MAG: hypothetical protein U9N61_05595 [Euryarchaeota archaeon]|nr:hypothetical protein [Euryarchaeota archaeon]
MKKLMLVLILLSLTGCGSLLSQKTVATLYNDDGSKMADLYNNKSYSGLKWTLKKGDTEIVYQSDEVNSASVAKEAVASQAKAIDMLSGVLNTAIGIASPIQ